MILSECQLIISDRYHWHDKSNSLYYKSEVNIYYKNEVKNRKLSTPNLDH